MPVCAGSLQAQPRAAEPARPVGCAGSCRPGAALTDGPGDGLVHGSLSPWHGAAAPAQWWCPYLCLSQVLERGEQSVARRWVGATRGRVDAAGQMVCLLQLVPALSGHPPNPLGRAGRRGLSASRGAVSPAGEGAGLPALRRYPSSLKRTVGALTGRRGVTGAHVPAEH